MTPTDNENTAIVNRRVGRLLPVPRLNTIIAFAVVAFLIYAFFSKLTLQFYASFLFLFYSWTNKMWISVMMLGVFQTLLMLPFRVINLLKSANLDEFQHTVTKMEIESEGEYFLKRQFKTGGRIALYYVVNFFVSTISYTSIGRLFLTDFYSVGLDSRLLYDFVPYPNYPLQDRLFKLPYLWFDNFADFGIDIVWIVWGVVLGLQIAFYAVVYFSKRNASLTQQKGVKRLGAIFTGNLVLFLLISWYLVRHFPVDWSLRIFSGDVAIPNRTLNAITAIATFITIIWMNLPKIQKKISLAEQAGIPKKIISRTSKDLLRENFKVASVVGIGAYYITNLIPSAFELSIFTLEIISWTAPLTLDRVILRSVGREEHKKDPSTRTSSVQGKGKD